MSVTIAQAANLTQVKLAVDGLFIVKMASAVLIN